MVRYEAFDIEFDDRSKGTNGWINEFGETDYEEFNVFFEYVFAERGAMMDVPDDKTAGRHTGPKPGAGVVQYPVMALGKGSPAAGCTLPSKPKSA